MANHPLSKNLLIIGACGGVGRAFLRKLVTERGRLGKLVLVDRQEPWVDDESLSFRELTAEFLKASIDVEKGREDYLRLLKTRGIDIVVDLSVNETRAMLALTDRAGVSYINTGVANRPGENFSEVVLDLVNRKRASWSAPHILCSGMNPGVVNLWVRRAIETSGVPKSIVHFEYDTGEPVNGGVPVIAWSKETLLDEIVNDPAGYVEGRNKIRLIGPNPLKNRLSMEEVLRPIMTLSTYPRGFLLLHEENITLGQEYDVPSRFLFSLKTETMDYLEEVYDKKEAVPPDTLALGDNRKVLLKGEATVGVCLEYEKARQYFLNTTAQGAVPGVSGSCRQVAAGLHAALWTVIDDPLENRVYFVEDLLGTSCERLMMANLPMQELIVKK
jgi:Saccharopine dehydrogenase NADP binding domain